jgi:thymidylate synthase (FAD)
VNRNELLEKYSEPIRVLDHGYVKLVDAFGDDERVVAAARNSYDGKGKSDSRGLIRYLRRSRHTTPFEHPHLTLDIKLPIFVARQLVRHRTQTISEVSGRYTILPEEVYIPEPSQVCYQATENKQGRAGPMPEEEATAFINLTMGNAGEVFNEYTAWCEAGLAKETARINLPLGTYTKWWSTQDLHNLFHMLGLRRDGHAQYEIRVYAEAIAQIVKDWVPLAFEAWEDYEFYAHRFSRMEVEMLRHLVDSFVSNTHHDKLREKFRQLFDHCGVETTRERAEFLKALGITLPKEE